jgi:hypothetical protein
VSGEGQVTAADGSLVRVRSEPCVGGIALTITPEQSIRVTVDLGPSGARLLVRLLEAALKDVEMERRRP